jgi:hypothetical protein
MVHLSQSQNEMRQPERRKERDNKEGNIFRHFVGERRGRPRDTSVRIEQGGRGDGGYGDRRDTRASVSSFREHFDDNISDLALDDADREGRNGVHIQLTGEGEVKNGRRAGDENRHVGEVEAKTRCWRRGSRERDCCTPEETRVVEEWITGCEGAKCKGFVKRVRERGESNERFEDAGEDEGEGEGEVNVRGGERGRNWWPEWGASWEAYRFMS